VLLQAEHWLLTALCATAPQMLCVIENCKPEPVAPFAFPLFVLCHLINLTEAQKIRIMLENAIQKVGSRQSVKATAYC
jgi:hypothetical protein